MELVRQETSANCLVTETNKKLTGKKDLDFEFQQRLRSAWGFTQVVCIDKAMAFEHTAKTLDQTGQVSKLI